MAIQILEGGHCLKCHQDYETNILDHLKECPRKDNDPTPCYFCDTSFKIINP